MGYLLLAIVVVWVLWRIADNVAESREESRRAKARLGQSEVARERHAPAESPVGSRRAAQAPKSRYAAKSVLTAFSVVTLVVIFAFVCAYVGERFFSKKTALETSVRDVLPDGDSAKFRGVQYFEATGGACGWVNAKNRLGAYVGFTRFYVTRHGEVAFEPEFVELDAETDAGRNYQLSQLHKRRDWLEAQLAVCPPTSR